MSMLDEAINGHPIHAILRHAFEIKKSQAYIDALAEVQSTEATSRDGKLFVILTALKNLLEKTPPDLVSGPGLDSLYSLLQSTLNELSQFRDNKNPEHLRTALNTAESQLMQQMWAFLPIATNDPSPTKAILDSLRATCKEAIKGIQLQAESSLKSINEGQQQWEQRQLALESKADAQAATLLQMSQGAETQTARINELTTQFSEKCGGIEAEFRDALGKQLADAAARFDAFDGDWRQRAKDLLDAHAVTIESQAAKIRELSDVVENQRKEAVGAAAEVKTAYTVVEQELRAQFASTLSEMSATFQTRESAAAERASALIGELESQRDEAAKIVQIVGNIGVTGNYQITAEKESNQANFWRWVTVGFFGVGVLLAATALAFQLFAPGDIKEMWPLFLTRIATAIAISLPAFYTARESARHRSNADRARQRELELASIGPFIALLPIDVKNEITKDLAQHYFGVDVAAHEVVPPISASDATGFVQALGGLVSKFKP